MSRAPEDTIAAISTPPGSGGIGIVRLSGPKAREILERIFRRSGDSGNAADSRPFSSHRFYLGEILHHLDGHVIDEALAVFMKKPKTYTREDVVEMQAHGGPLVLRDILEPV
ncbi:MAG TPA: tRNA uridine-5-carboxymethylaminomethyl(34) synthesis GTPase MnmE, partial [Thermodesulfobacteriota bacterium]|nr:tRNA uridine-5-carboxymethylaminomethyl(34) synthesis GTPase MnmE [Thermodesulfobacteriota bacterium]